jgi:hypothetical protein
MAVPGADCAVAVVESFAETPETAAALRTLRSGHPETAFVVVTRFDRQNVELLPDTADRFVSLPDMVERLGPAVAEAAGALCPRLERYVSTQVRHSDTRRSRVIRDDLRALLRADPPVRTVKEWCGLVCCAVSTMEKRFANEFESGITALSVVEAVRLYRALDEFPNARSWTNLAEQAGSRWYGDGQLSPKTLSDAAARLLGKVREPDETRQQQGNSGWRARWDPPLTDRRALFDGLRGLLR